MPKVSDYDLEDDERRLERAQAARESNGSSLPSMSAGEVSDVPWMHVESDDQLEDSDEAHEGTDAEDAIDAFMAAFNEHDLEGCLETTSADCECPGLDRADEDLPVALSDLWERRPTGRLTAAELDDYPAAMLWEVGHDNTWWRLAVVRFTINPDLTIDCIAFDDAPDEIDRCIAEAPEAVLDEGATWQEWEEGVVD